MITLTELEMQFITVFVFLMGACIGSFLNVCIYRIPRDESLAWPGSHCPKCNTPIKFYNNVPILSYILLRGRCKDCHERISPRYMLVEALVAVLFLLVWFQHGFSVKTPIYWVAVSGLVVGTFVDFEHMIIPDRVTLGGIAFGLVLSPLIPSLHNESTWLGGLIASVIGAVAGAGSLWLVGFFGKLALKKDAMGLGDVKLLGGVGALLGWKAVVFTLMVSSVVGSAVGIILIATKGKEWQSRIPYGPYLALATLLWILYGAPLWDWYVGFLSGAQM